MNRELTNHHKEKKPRLTREERVLKVKELLMKGYGINQITSTLGYSKNTVISIVRQLNSECIKNTPYERH